MRFARLVSTMTLAMLFSLMACAQEPQTQANGGGTGTPAPAPAAKPGLVQVKPEQDKKAKSLSVSPGLERDVLVRQRDQNDLNAQFESLSKQQAEMRLVQADLQRRFNILAGEIESKFRELEKAAPLGYKLNRQTLMYDEDPDTKTKAAGEKKSKE